MAHFAEIDSNNIVVRVLVVPNERETDGQHFLSTELGLGGTWIQTSYNNNIRANYAAEGYTYDPVNDVFIPPQPFASWQLNNTSYQWEAPSPHPNDGQPYNWNEATLSWELIV